MYNYITSWFFAEEEKPIEVTPKTKQNRYNVLKEVNQFDKSILLPVSQSLEEFVGETKKPSKIFTFKRTEKKKRVRKRKRKKSS